MRLYESTGTEGLGKKGACVKIFLKLCNNSVSGGWGGTVSVGHL